MPSARRSIVIEHVIADALPLARGGEKDRAGRADAERGIKREECQTPVLWKCVADRGDTCQPSATGEEDADPVGAAVDRGEESDGAVAAHDRPGTEAREAAAAGCRIADEGE